MSGCLLPQHDIQLADGRGELQQVGPLFPDALAQRPNLIHAFATVINEGAAKHLGIFNRVRMHLRIANVRIHDLEVPFSNVAGGSRWGDEMRPCVPLINQRLDLDILLQIETLGASDDVFLPDCWLDLLNEQLEGYPSRT